MLFRSGVPWGKPLRAEKRTKKTQLTYDAESGNRMPVILLEGQARSRGEARVSSPPPEIFRFELNSTAKVEFCLLKLTAFSGSYSFQVLSVTLLMFCAIWSCVKERDRIFALPKTTNSFKISAYFSSK